MCSLSLLLFFLSLSLGWFATPPLSLSSKGNKDGLFLKELVNPVL